MMVDLAKAADLVLMLIDASFGFEMETSEFLNIFQVHGFPKIMGVLTHLDSSKHNKKRKKTKKRLKHRFWTEVYPGAKLFYLSGMVHGEYQNQEMHNLGRFITVMKFRPLTWQTSHPYKRCLNEKEKVVYVPLSGVGRVLYDKDAVYVDLSGSHGFQASDEVGPTHELVQSLISTISTIDAKMTSSRVTLFSDSKPLGSEAIDNQGEVCFFFYF
nr:ribosome biogenesis protein BMS1 homolog [Macaca nemestrina]